MDYNKIGLKVGLEIHQQLDTGKLFCRCPSYLRKEVPDFIVKRRLHKVAGETGDIDAAVEYEASLNKEFEYQGYDNTTCLVELDEEPPKEINEEALNEAIKISLLLNCEIYPVVQIMRKTVIDGSNTSGFQRTTLIAHSGEIETSFGKVPVESVALEEDSARLVSEKGSDKVTFRLDRLGIPLIEIATAPTMNSPEQVKEAALKIGEILRACKVRRGIGTIRQDVNVSIRGHDKAEIKGFQEPRTMITTIEKEIERQKEELKKGKKEGEVRNSLPDGSTNFLRPSPGRARMYPETDLPLLKISRERINKIKKQLPKLKNEIRDELKKKGLTDELINLILDGHLDEFETLMRVYNKDANLVAKMTTLWRRDISAKTAKSMKEINDILNERALEKILEVLTENKISKGDIKTIMEKIVSGEKLENSLKTEKLSDDELEEEISKFVKEKPGLSAKAYMGLIMKQFKGKIDAKKAMEILEKMVK
ncbi:Glu-tRNA(Gln) amidotransferase subunit GatE [Candidatus Pacearchaeota archaeon]|nr:Glu-tRNA(Gln) amidotransferase subunit GatE [Candidatus Pacearchaeota archaeon]